MKRIIQITLFSIVLISITVLQKIYFSDDEKQKVDNNVPTDQMEEQTENNIIRNLKYEVKLEENNLYIIKSDFSELTYINEIELVKMQGVVAKFIDKNGLTLTIRSDEALYNNSNYNTKFRKNVQINYMKNKIFSNKIDINFQDNTVKIFENVRYVSLDGTIQSDNILLNLITKRVTIYMDNENENIDVIIN